MEKVRIVTHFSDECEESGFRSRSAVSTRRALFFLLFLLSATFLFADTVGEEKEYIWPLTYKGCLTSSFAEYRQGHFHAGIDLSTNGKTGYKVRAITDGEVYRVRTSPYGYGKSIYLSFPDGRIAVYAHLSDFAPHIRELVEREQERLECYSIDLRFPSGTVSVSAGEVIGYSGQTGIGAPHLHFELRDGENVPINPILNGFPIADTEPPIIRSVMLIPLESDSRVDGSLRPLRVDLDFSDEENCYRTDRVVRIEGPVGVTMNCDDIQNACGNRRLGVYSFDLLVDNKTNYRTRFDHFSYDVSQLVGIEFDLGMIESGGGRFHRLYSTAPNLLPFTMTDLRHAGVIVGEGRDEYGNGAVLSRGLHYLEARALDANENRSRAVLGVVVGEPPEIRRMHVVDDSKVIAFLDESPSEIGDFLVSRSLNGGRMWETGKARYSIDRGSWVADDFTRLDVKRKPLIFRLDISTIEGAHSKPVFLFQNYEKMPTPEPILDLSLEYYADALLIVLDLDRVFPYKVEARVIRDQKSPLRPAMEQVSPTRFEGVLALPDLEMDAAWIEVSLVGPDGSEWSSMGEIQAVRVSALSGGEVTDKGGRASMRFERSSLVRDTHFRVNEVEAPPLERDLIYVSPVYSFEPQDALLREKTEISIRPFADNGEGKRVALYRLDSHGRWRYANRRIDPDNPTISVRTRSLARYALIRDDAVPSIFGLSPAEDAVVRTNNPRLQAKITDIGSGFESEDLRIQLDGRFVIAEWDPERDLLTYKVRKPLHPGSHHMKVLAVDRAGNSVTKESNFYVSGNQ